tara:strand:- start:6 stop:440 length:435 start_codon:yes stop_codon:yes gene_type:complete
MDENNRSFVKMSFGIVSFIVSLFVYISGNFGDAFVSATIAPDNVGTFSYEAMSKAAEVLFAVITAVIGTGVFSNTKWLTLILAVLKPLFDRQEPISVESQFETDMMRMIAHSIATKNAAFTVMLCEELAGSPYITTEDDPESVE